MCVCVWVCVCVFVCGCDVCVCVCRSNVSIDSSYTSKSNHYLLLVNKNESNAFKTIAVHTSATIHQSSSRCQTFFAKADFSTHIDMMSALLCIMAVTLCTSVGSSKMVVSDFNSESVTRPVAPITIGVIWYV